VLQNSPEGEQAGHSKIHEQNWSLRRLTSPRAAERDESWLAAPHQNTPKTSWHRVKLCFRSASIFLDSASYGKYTAQLPQSAHKSPNYIVCTSRLEDPEKIICTRKSGEGLRNLAILAQRKTDIVTSWKESR